MPGAEPAYLTQWLPGLFLSGLGVGMVLPSLAGAAVAGLPAAQYAVGSAVNQATRQLGAVLGVAITVLLVGHAGVARADFMPMYGMHVALALVTGALCLLVNTSYIEAQNNPSSMQVRQPQGGQGRSSSATPASKSQVCIQLLPFRASCRPCPRYCPIAKSTASHPPLLLGLLSNLVNRHGCITGATGTGKTVTLQVIAQSLSDIGVPVFMADVKGDLSGMAKAGARRKRWPSRLETLGLEAPRGPPARSRSGTCSASRATRCAPPSPTSARCCWRAC